MIGRFQVMSLLQYERFRKLGFSDIESKSLAIFFSTFYACLKNRHLAYNVRIKNSRKKKSNKNLEIFNNSNNNNNNDNRIDIFGIELQYVKENNERIFLFGKERMDDRKFNNVLLRFKTNENFQKCLKEIREYIDQFPLEILQNHNKFFNKVYKPVRDTFVEKWNREIWNG